jgi:CRP-like cAMP-binding protein
MIMAAFLAKLLNVRSGEWRRLSLLYGMSLVALTGINWGEAIVQAAFLQRVGVQYLPWVFISSAACSLGALFIYTAFADRVSNTRLLIAIMSISCAGVVLGLAGLAAGQVSLAYLLLYLVLNVPLMDVYNVHWATYVNGFYDIRAAKRIVPVLGTAARLAGIIAGLSMPLLNRLFSPSAIIAVMGLALAVMAALAAAMPRILGERRAGCTGSPGLRNLAGARLRAGLTRPGRRAPGWVQGVTRAYSANLREGYQQIARSPFLAWMALSTLSMTILLALLNYQASAVFQAELKTTVQISNFLGVLSGLANLVILPIQLFLLSRLITRLGLGNVSLVYPFVNLAAAGSLVVAPGLGTAAFAYLDRTALRTAFRSPIDNLLYNAVPLRVKARTRAFVGGLVVPVGTIAGGLLLLTPLKRTSWFLPVAILGLALIFALAALLVRRHYAQALVAMLEHEDYSSLALQAPTLQAPAILPAADQATLNRLAQRLNACTSPERAIFMARLIVEIGNEAAVPIIGQAAHAATDNRLRAALVDVLAAAEMRRGGVRELYVELLAEGDGQVRVAAIGGLEQIDGPRDARYLAIAGSLVHDPDIAVRLRVLPALLAAGDTGHRSAASAELRALLDTQDLHTRARALSVVGQVRASAYISEVARSLTDGADEVRLAAALAAELLAGAGLPPGDQGVLLPPVLVLLHDPIERARVAAVAILGLNRDAAGSTARAAREGVTMALTDPSPRVREHAIEALARAGRQAIPYLRELLDAADPQMRKMAAVVLARIEPRKYAPLVRGPMLNDNLLTIYRNLVSWQTLAGCPGPTVAVLRRALCERNTALLDEIFYLLSTIQDPAAVRTIARALRSPQPPVRANAAEALESLTTPQTAALVAPLFEQDLPAEQLLSLAEKMGAIRIPTPTAALSLLLADAGDAWLGTLAAAALPELGAPATPLAQAELTRLPGPASTDLDPGVRAQAGAAWTGGKVAPEATGLSFVKKLILMQEVPFCQGMTVDQLKELACVCEEEQFPAGARIFEQGQPGGAFYLVISGQVAIEQETRVGSYARLATIDAHACFGESELFDNSPRSTAAVALQETLSLRLRREPLIELAGRQPGIWLELMNVLAQRLREANAQIAELARSRPRKLHRLFDAFEEAGADPESGGQAPAQ